MVSKNVESVVMSRDSSSSSMDEGDEKRYRTVTQIDSSEVLTHVNQADGTVILKPISTSSTRPKRKIKVKQVVEFVPRVSHFDRYHPDSGVDTFRGFYTLAWILLALVTVRTMYRSYVEHGSGIGLTFARLITKDGLVLAISDFVLVFSTFLCVPFVKLFQYDIMNYHYTGVILQHIGQTLYLVTAIRWTFFRKWYWVQSGFLTLHSLTMLMKIHSYLAVNGAMSLRAKKLKKAMQKLDKLLAEQKVGWQEASSVAEQARDDFETNTVQEAIVTSDIATSNAIDRTRSRSPNPTSPVHSILRHRRKSLDAASASPTLATIASQKGDEKNPYDLLGHPDPDINSAAETACDLLDELVSSGSEHVKWPQNVSMANYLDYLLVPTLVYELEYPRTHAIRPLYVLEKTLATFGTFSVIYIIVEYMIMPIHQNVHHSSIASAMLDLGPPFIVNYLLIFYIIFECICNGFAELTRFADRQFYEDWWNSTTFEEFARKWNKPVHSFLLRHVYASTIQAYRLPKFWASFLTFLLSACVHELVMAVVSKKLRLYLFLMQMCQLPMIMVARMSFLKRNPTLGNIIFWLGLMSGFPLLAVGYLRY